MSSPPQNILELDFRFILVLQSGCEIFSLLDSTILTKIVESSNNYYYLLLNIAEIHRPLYQHKVDNDDRLHVAANSCGT